MPAASRSAGARPRPDHRTALGLSVVWSLIIVGAMALIILAPEPTPAPLRDRAAKPANWSVAQRTGSRFTAVPDDPYRPPEHTEVAIPGFPSGDAVWGATGRDRRGRVWIGVSERHGNRSARLFELDPRSGLVEARGSVVSELKRNGAFKLGEGQSIIQSRIVQADDGYLYFSSMDDEGESSDGSSLPRWGSHLWRLRPGERGWKHLFATREALIAVSGVGRWIYALGYWDHVVYQYDTRSGNVQSVSVGSVGGHASRNFLSDEHGHVYVPRLLRTGATTASGAEEIAVSLVELDPQLREVAETPLEHYLKSDEPDRSHGIIGVTYLADGSMVFVTHLGYLYRIHPRATSSAKVEPIGWFHPDGEAYTASLFTFSGERYLAGIGQPAGGDYQWLVYDLERRESAALPLDLPDSRKLLLYGSITRDDQGRFYVAGRHSVPGRNRPKPLVLQLGLKGGPAAARP